MSLNPPPSVPSAPALPSIVPKISTITLVPEQVTIAMIVFIHDFFCSLFILSNVIIRWRYLLASFYREGD